MKLLPSSARSRRRLGILGAVVAVGLGVWGLSLLLPAPKHESAAPNEKGSNKLVFREKQVPLRRAERRTLNRLLDEFIPAAVERKDPAAAYRLATTGLRQSATRAEWRRGNIPVYPYPASKNRDWTLNFSYPNDVNVDLFIQKVEKGGQPLSQADLGPGNVKGTSQTGKARLSPLFFLIPPGFIALVLLIPIVMFVRSKLSEAKSERTYAMTPRRTLPPLPKPRERS